MSGRITRCNYRIKCATLIFLVTVMSDIVTGQLTQQMFVSYFNCFYRMQLNIFKEFESFAGKEKITFA